MKSTIDYKKENMKKLIIILLSISSFILVGCTNKVDNTTNTNNNEIKTEENNTSSLVLYFSATGNTEKIAKLIANVTNSNIEKILPENEYTSSDLDYNSDCRANKEQNDPNARPEIKNTLDISSYDTIYIGYPIWWHTAPMIIGTFLNSYDLSNKDIYPFSQSASMDIEQFNNSIEFIKNNTNGIVHDGLFASKNDTNKIDKYLEEIKY